MIKSSCSKCQRDIYVISLPFICRCGFKIMSDNNVNGSGVSPIVVKTKIVMDEHIEAYRSHWLKLHSFPADRTNKWSADKAKKFLSQWENDIPSGSCGCRSGWNFIKESIDSPTKYDSPELFFQWSVEAHNAVNKKLNKSIVSYEKACQIHGF